MTSRNNWRSEASASAEPADPEGSALHELAAELRAIHPSPGFASGVRSRVHHSPRASRWLLVPAIVAVLLIAATLPGRRSSESPTPQATRVAVAPEIAPATVPETPGSGPTLANPDRAVAPARRRVRAPHAAAPAASATLEVMTSQAAVLAELWRAHEPAAGKVGVVELPADRVLVDADGFIQVPELIVAPIVTRASEPAPGAQGGVKRIVSPQAAGSPR